MRTWLQFPRWTTFLGITRWECPTWLDTVRTTRRGYTTEPARFPLCRPTQPTLAAKLDLDFSSAQTPTQMSQLELWWVGPPITQTRSLIQGLSFRSRSPQRISMPHWWACSLSFQLILDIAIVKSNISRWWAKWSPCIAALEKKKKRKKRKWGRMSVIVFQSEVVIYFLSIKRSDSAICILKCFM